MSEPHVIVFDDPTKTARLFSSKEAADLYDLAGQSARIVPVETVTAEDEDSDRVDAILAKFADASDIVKLAEIRRVTGAGLSEAKHLLRAAVMRAIARQASV